MTLIFILVALAYMAGLFWLANWGDKPTQKAKQISHHPLVYALALGIYCTSWTYYGAVGTATRDGWDYLPILLGPALLFIFGKRFLHKLILVSKKQNITTIADFISSRYGKRPLLPILVTIIALLATIPYIALQLKALNTSFFLLNMDTHVSGSVLGLAGTLMMAFFAIFFGTRKVDVTEYRSGLMLAVAFESLVKLFALACVAGLSWYLLKQQDLTFIEEISHSQWQHTDITSFNFIGQTLIAAAAIVCLPRQFHVAVVDNHDLKHLRTARWAFPGYLILTMLVILPIAMAASNSFIAGDLAPDSFVLALPVSEDFQILAVLVFIGGLSAATAMIVVATLTLSTMISNDVILPLILKRKPTKKLINTSYQQRILFIRRITIAAILVLAYIYQQMWGHGSALAAMGLVAFSLVTQLLPAIVGGLYWKKGHAYGVYAGLIAGFICWVLFLMMPVLMFGAESTIASQNLITQGTFIALIINIIFYISFSIAAQERLIDRIQAAAFVSPKEAIELDKRPQKHIKATVFDLKILMHTFLGSERSQQLLASYDAVHLLAEDKATPEQELIHFCERALTGVIGASSARSLINAVIAGKSMAFEEVVNFFDETTQALQFNQNLLFTSLENISHGISVVDKDLKIVAWNKRYAEMFEFPDGFLQVGQDIEEVLRYNVERGECGPGSFELLINKRIQHLKNGTPHHYIRRRRNNRVVEMVGNPLPDGGFVTSFSDVTNHIETQHALEKANTDLEMRIAERTQEILHINEDLEDEVLRRREIEIALKQAMAETEKANNTKTRFLALASHDILQPLNAARLYLEAIDEKELTTTNRQTLDKLGDSLNSTVHLMSSLLEIARLEQGELKPSPKPFMLSDILQPLQNEYSLVCKEKGLAFKVLGQDYPVTTDMTYLRRIIQNLVSNAVKYTNQGKVLLTVRKQSGIIKISVWDTGRGISELEQARIFNDFYRVKNADAQGVGLGLGVVKRMTELLNLSLTVHSNIEKGSCFSIELPMGELPTSINEPECSTHIEQPGSLNLLVVDDELENLNAMSRLLDKWHCHSQCFNQIDDALNFAQSNQAPDMILMDYQLNDQLDGIEMIEKLRSIWGSEVPAVLITAVRGEDIKLAVKHARINYLSKPVKPAKLKALMKAKLPRI